MFNKKLYITIITIISILILSISCGNSMTDSTNGGNGENQSNQKSLGSYAGTYKGATGATYDEIVIKADSSTTFKKTGETTTITGTVSKAEGNKFSITLSNGEEIIIEFGDNNSITITKSDGSTESATVYTITVQYGSKTANIDPNDSEKIEKLWKNMISDKIIYEDKNYSKITGGFGIDANYYEQKYESSNKARTVFVKCRFKELNGINYIAGVYYDNYNQYNMPNDWRLIVIGNDGTEHAWYGGGRDRNNIPNENTAWTYYTFRFGYLKNY